MFQRRKNGDAVDDAQELLLGDGDVVSERIPAVSAPSPGPAPSPGTAETRIGAGVRFEGKLRFEGQAHVEGELQGEIEGSGVLTVGRGARVEANLDVGTLRLHGCVEGNVRASEAVEIVASGTLRGDLKTPALKVDPGAHFVGHCDMGDA